MVGRECYMCRASRRVVGARWLLTAGACARPEAGSLSRGPSSWRRKNAGLPRAGRGSPPVPGHEEDPISLRCVVLEARPVLDQVQVSASVRDVELTIDRIRAARCRIPRRLSPSPRWRRSRRGRSGRLRGAPPDRCPTAHRGRYRFGQRLELERRTTPGTRPGTRRRVHKAEADEGEGHHRNQVPDSRGRRA